MAVQFEPVLLGIGPLLDWFPELFARLPWIVPADEFAPGVPDHDMPPRVLARYVIEQADYRQRDQIWAGIVHHARQPATAHTYKLIAFGVAAKGLLGYRSRLPIRQVIEAADVDADLAVGLLRRLSTIDLDARNIGGRLIDSAIGYAKRRWRHHLDRPRPVDLDPDRHDVIAPVPDSVESALNAVAARLADAGQPLDPVDLALIASTRLDGETVLDVAARLGLPAEAAYKRRQRAEQRIAALLRRGPPATRRPPALTYDGATAATATPGSATRRTAANPATR